MRELAQIRFERAARAAADAKAEEEKQVHEELSEEAEEVAPDAEHVCVPFAEDWMIESATAELDSRDAGRQMQKPSAISPNFDSEPLDVQQTCTCGPDHDCRTVVPNGKARQLLPSSALPFYLRTWAFGYP